MKIFATVSDLRLWVSERVGELETPDEVDQITGAIHSMDDFPNWGEDASEFLETLPDDLSKLLKPVFPEYKLVIRNLWLDANQGTDVDDKAFGFIGTDKSYEDHDGDDKTYCGWFFTWPTHRAKITSEAERQAVIDSLETDETERYKKEIPHELAVEKLEAYLAKKFPGDLDHEGE